MHFHDAYPCSKAAGSRTGWTGQLCEVLFPKLIPATKAANPKNRWSLMSERYKMDICRASENLCIYFSLHCNLFKTAYSRRS